MQVLQGQKASAGVAAGVIFYFKRQKACVQARPVCDTQKELSRAEAATAEALRQIDALRSAALEKMGSEEASLFEFHSMMLSDLDFQDSISGIITGEKMNAEYAVWKTAEIFEKMFADMEREYMRARSEDVRDVSMRLLAVLQGNASVSPALQSPAIIACDDLSPSETVLLDRDKTLGLVTAGGSANSHTAIFARNMGIPAVVALGPALDESCHGKEAAVDGEAGALYIAPDEETAKRLAASVQSGQKEKASLAALVGQPSRTKGGREIKLFANIGGPEDMESVLANDAEGIGLFRSEFLYLQSDNFPSEEAQYGAYKEVAQKMAGRLVIIRTLDIGADKQAAYFNLPHEENPALGMRALRICLTRPEIFKVQLRAIYRAAAHGNVALMFPMVASLWELREAKEIAESARRDLGAKNIPLGIMIETPAAALISEDLAKECDFFSVGTNDLTQYTLAVDRQNNALGRFTDTHHRAVLALLEMTAKNARKAGIPAGICGELAGDKSLTRAFIEMGFHELSVPPPAILPLRKFIREM